MKYEEYDSRESYIVKSMGRRKASKVTYKTHRKHKMLPKEEQKELPPHSVAGLKPEDIINRQQG